MFIGLYCSSISAFSQSQKDGPVNFMGLIGGAEWKTFNLTSGLDYERIILKRKNISVGGKVFFTPYYKYGNEHLSFSGNSSGYNGEKGTHLLFLGSASFFPSNEEADKGIFLTASLGPGLNIFRDIPNGNAVTNTTSLTGGFELGLGFLIQIGNKTALKLSAANIMGSFTKGLHISDLP